MICRNCSSCMFSHSDKNGKPVYRCIGVREPFEIEDINKECTEYPEKNTVTPEKLETIVRSAIKASGTTTEFETGAHRDTREGKGRCDLLPLEVVSAFVGDDGLDPVLDSIAEFQKTNKTSRLYNALAYFDEKHWDNCYTMMLEVAKHYEEGAKHYGENNWKKGIPVHIYIDSAIRHYLKWLRGDEDEPHARSFVWNVMCCIWEVDFHKKED